MGWVLRLCVLWPLQNCTVQFPFSDTLALCVTLGKFLSLSGPTLLFLEDGWTPTSQLLVKIVWTVAPCVLMKVKEESEKVGLKLDIQKTEIMASGPITSS